MDLLLNPKALKLITLLRIAYASELKPMMCGGTCYHCASRGEASMLQHLLR